MLNATFCINWEVQEVHISVPSRKPMRKPAAEHLVNEDIPFYQMYVLGQDGQKLGMMRKREAVELAKSSGFDLVIISDNPEKPVAKILDYGRFKYDRKKKRREVMANQTVVENREVRLTPMIGDHDLQVKSRKAREFLLRGDRVKVSLKFRGREMSRKDLGFTKLDDFFKTLEDIAKIEKTPVFSNTRFLDMYLVRDKSKGTSAKEEKNAKNEDQKRANETRESNSERKD